MEPKLFNFGSTHFSSPPVLALYYLFSYYILTGNFKPMPRTGTGIKRARFKLPVYIYSDIIQHLKQISCKQLVNNDMLLTEQFPKYVTTSPLKVNKKLVRGCAGTVRYKVLPVTCFITKSLLA